MHCARSNLLIVILHPMPEKYLVFALHLQYGVCQMLYATVKTLRFQTTMLHKYTHDIQIFTRCIPYKERCNAIFGFHIQQNNNNKKTKPTFYVSRTARRTTCQTKKIEASSRPNKSDMTSPTE